VSAEAFQSEEEPGRQELKPRTGLEAKYSGRNLRNPSETQRAGQKNDEKRVKDL
jgi:hypothetical protein